MSAMAAFHTIQLIIDNAAFSELVNSVVAVAVAAAVVLTDNNL